VTDFFKFSEVKYLTPLTLLAHRIKVFPLFCTMLDLVIDAWI